MPNTLYNPKRIDPIIEQLRALWMANPHMRLGQLIMNFSDGRDTFYVDDITLKSNMARYANSMDEI